MKIVIVSDTHGMTAELKRVYELYKDTADYFIHCGDIGFDVSQCNELANFITVTGNCDIGEVNIMESIHLPSNHSILVTHGHLLDVKWNLNRLYFTALEQNATIVCYGHTHQPLCEKMDDIIMINPGSLFANRGVRGKTFAILTINGDDLNVTHYDAKTFDEYQLS